jgi:hypothetical protein
MCGYASNTAPEHPKEVEDKPAAWIHMPRTVAEGGLEGKIQMREGQGGKAEIKPKGHRVILSVSPHKVNGGLRERLT